ncbi:MAG TPA: hypothetical protein VFL64_05885 [Rhizobacter sp.]|nr:hypothetical protein [Rhizobacter sp.]
MNGTKLLIPAAMLTASLGVGAKIAPAPAPVDKATTEAQRVVTPAVLGVRAPDSYPIPQRLQDYTDSAATQIARPCTGSRCGSISGSGNGWDDSDQ